MLSYLSQVKHCHGYGVEIDDAEVLACARRGVDVIQRNIEDGLGMFRGGDKFDVVVLSMALQATKRTEKVLEDMSHVAREGIVSFPNFGHWFHVWSILRGRMPITLLSVGLTERDALAAGYTIKVAAKPVAAIAAMPRAKTLENPRGIMKFVIDAETDQILGAQLLVVESMEVINLVALAMRHNITASQLRDEIYTHPSITEGLNEVLANAVPVN